MSTELQELLEQGINYHQKGSLDLAQRKYSKILHLDPYNPDALHLSGIVQFQSKNYADALHLINKALEIRPGEIKYLLNLTNVYQEIGEFEKAEHILKIITNEDKLNIQAWLNLGNCYLAQKKYRHAINSYEQALEINPFYLKAVHCIAIAYLEQKSFKKAAEYFKKVIDMNGPNPDIYNSIAVCYYEDECLITALEYFDKALKIDPDSLIATLNKGIIYHKQEKYKEAQEVLEQIIKIDPYNIAANLNLGYINNHLQHYIQALNHFNKIIQIDKNNLTAKEAIAETYFKMDEFFKSIEMYNEILNHKQDVYTYFNIGLCYFQQKNMLKAIEYIEKSLKLEPDNPEISNKLTECYYNLGDFNKCREYCEYTLLHYPENALARCFYGNSYLLEGKYEDAKLHLEQAVLLDKNKETNASYSISFLQMRDGKLQTALENGYKLRWQSSKKLEARPYDYKWWSGQSLKGKTILLWGEQGIGDLLMFASMIPEFASQCKECIIEVDKRLVDLFARSFPNIKVYPQTKNPHHEILAHKIDYQVPFGDLLIYFKPKQDYAVHNGYLKPDHDIVKRIRKEYNHFIGRKPKVGISWCSANNATGKLRSIDLEELLPILKNSNVHWIDVQYGNFDSEIQDFFDKHQIPLFSDKAVDSFLDLDKFAAQIASLDLVISVANSTVHMAGAVATPVWVMVPKAPSWRWMINRSNNNQLIESESLWYPHIKLFHQDEKEDNWNRVINEVARVLDNQFKN